MLALCRNRVFRQEAVVYQRLNLKVVVKGCDFLDFGFVLSFENCLVKLARSAGGAQYQALSVRLDDGAREPRFFLEIIKMRI